MTDDPNEALASIQAARAEVGKKLDYPVGWDIAYGLIFAGLVGGAGLPNPWSILLLVLSLAALAFMVKWWRERVGWWVNGYAPKNARWVAVGMVGIMLVLMMGSYWTRFGDGPWWMPIVTGGLAWVLGVVGGRIWMKVYRKEIEELS